MNVSEEEADYSDAVMEARYQRFLNETGLKYNVTVYSSDSTTESDSDPNDMEEWIKVSKRIDRNTDSEIESSDPDCTPTPTKSDTLASEPASPCASQPNESTNYRKMQLRPREIAIEAKIEANTAESSSSQNTVCYTRRYRTRSTTSFEQKNVKTEPKLKQLLCNYAPKCQKKFFKPGNLRAHLGNHSGELFHISLNIA